MTNIYEEAYKEAERKIKKLSEDFKKDLDKIFKECTKKKPEEPDFSKMSTREILMWEIKNAKSEVVKIDTVEIEEEVWESTLNRSTVLQSENDKLKTDCRTLAQKLLQVKPELKGWLEKHYGEYL